MRQVIKGRVFRLLVLAGSICVIVTVSRSLWSNWQKLSLVRQREVELARVEAKNKQLKERLEQVYTPEFVEREAREKLGLTKEGEVVVLLQQASSGAQASNDLQVVPNWRQWWELFF